MPTAGTFMLDGLVQGPVPDAAALQAWVTQAARASLRFSLEIEGSRFSLLADNATVPTVRVDKTGLTTAMTEALEALLALYPGGRATLYSTIRSREFRPGAEVQTLYVINPDGTISAQSREIEADVMVPAPALGMRGRILRGCIVLAVLLLIGLATLPFLNWRRLFDRSRLMGSATQGVELNAGALAPFVLAKLTAVKQLDGLVQLELSRGAEWDAANPGVTDDPLPSPEAKMTWQHFLALSAVKRGTARCCFYDDKGDYTGESNVPIESLVRTDKLTLDLSIPRSRSLLKRVVLKP